MQNSAAAEATYTISTPAPTTYTVTVENGTGGGSFAAGETASIFFAASFWRDKNPLCADYPKK
ncbi:MAG: hypothetical protein E7425_06550 [Ruminococcaceae bacterium]|nr:hypothetical protein [Oscillospiraceae bacterium]